MLRLSLLIGTAFFIHTTSAQETIHLDTLKKNEQKEKILIEPPVSESTQEGPKKAETKDAVKSDTLRRNDTIPPKIKSAKPLKKKKRYNSNKY